MSKSFSPDEINSLFPTLTLTERVAWISKHFERPIFTTNLGMEDQVLTRAIADGGRSIQLITVDTGRLFQETQILRTLTEDRYGLKIKLLQPDEKDVADFVKNHGIDGMYDSRETRDACCDLRKSNPMRAPLSEADVWITALRRETSQDQKNAPFASLDKELGLIKVNPLADWSFNDVMSAVAGHEIPVNSLHRLGYPTIDCEPCTRAVKEGEHETAGLWWWEKDTSSEMIPHADRAIAAEKQEALVAV